MRAVLPVALGAALLVSQSAFAAEEETPGSPDAEMQAKLDAALASLNLTPLGELEEKSAMDPSDVGPNALPLIKSDTPELSEVVRGPSPDVPAVNAPSVETARTAGSYAIAEDPKRYTNVKVAKRATLLIEEPEIPVAQAVAADPTISDAVEASAPARLSTQGELRIRASDGMSSSLAALRQRTLANPIAYPVPIAQAPRSIHGPILKEGTYRPPSEFADIARMVARMHSVPEDLFFKLVKAESNWNPNAVSRVGALGLAQLMPGTAELLGVDPLDPFQNLEGGARYLSQQYARFGSWDLALAAYNAGPGAVTQYGGIPPYPETQNYVRKILGTEIAQNNAR